MRLVALSVAALTGFLALTAGNNVALAAPEKETNKTSKTIKIQPGDTLSSIAETNGSTVQRLFDANLRIENHNLIFPDTDLRIPSKDEKLATRPMPVAVVSTEQAVVEPVAAEAPAAVVSQPSRVAAAAPVVATGSVWDRLAQCEAGGNWSINTGNGYYGGLQFSLSSWQAVGGSGLPSDASREEQIMRGEMLLARQGWGAWPSCSSKLGLR